MATKKAEKRSTLDLLLEAVGAHYREKGDHTTAGVSLAKLDGGFYASVVRYQNGPLHKKVVVATRPTAGHLTADDAIADVAEKWYAAASAPNAEQALRALGDNLGEE